MSIQSALKTTDATLDAIRKAADSERPKAALRDDLEAADADAWRERGEMFDAEATSLTEASEALREYAEAATRLVALAENCHFPQSTVDELEDQLELLTDESELGKWEDQANELERCSGEFEAMSETCTTYADQVDQALSALDEWEGAEREERADARDALVEALTELVEAFDALREAIGEHDDPEES